MLVKLYLITVFVSALIGLYHFRHLPVYLKLFSAMLVATFAVECAGYFLVRKNAWLFNIYTSLEFVFYFLLYRYHIRSKRTKKLFLYFAAIYPVVSIANMTFFQGFFVFNNYTHSFGCILICVCVLFYYRQLLNSVDPQPLIYVPMFWISTGLLVYYACNFFFMGLFQYILSVSMDLAKQLFMIISVLNILMYSLFSIGIACSATRQK